MLVFALGWTPLCFPFRPDRASRDQLGAGPGGRGTVASPPAPHPLLLTHSAHIQRQWPNTRQPGAFTTTTAQIVFFVLYFLCIVLHSDRLEKMGTFKHQLTRKELHFWGNEVLWLGYGESLKCHGGLQQRNKWKCTKVGRTGVIYAHVYESSWRC